MRDPRYKMRMGMTDRNHRMTAIHIQVLLTRVIPEIRSLCPGDGDVVDGVYVE